MAFQFQVKKTGGLVPPRILIHGLEGTGKSTFASNAPSPIFIQTENGLSALQTNTLGLAGSYDEFEAMLDWVLNEPHAYQTLVIDSADWAEPLIAQKVADEHGLVKFDKSAKVLAYGRASEALRQKWDVILQKLDKIWTTRRMAIIVIAHTKTKKQDNPMHGSFDKLMPELESGGASAIVQWADIVGYAQKKMVIQETSDSFGNSKSKVRETNGNMTFLHTMNHPAYSAKCRWNIPYELPLDYAVFHSHLTAAMQAGQVQAAPAAAA